MGRAHLSPPTSGVRSRYRLSRQPVTESYSFSIFLFSTRRSIKPLILRRRVTGESSHWKLQNFYLRRGTPLHRYTSPRRAHPTPPSPHPRPPLPPSITAIRHCHPLPPPPLIAAHTL